MKTIANILLLFILVSLFAGCATINKGIGLKSKADTAIVEFWSLEKRFQETKDSGFFSAIEIKAINGSLGQIKSGIRGYESNDAVNSKAHFLNIHDGVVAITDALKKRENELPVDVKSTLDSLLSKLSDINKVRKDKVDGRMIIALDLLPLLKQAIDLKKANED